MITLWRLSCNYKPIEFAVVHCATMRRLGNAATAAATIDSACACCAEN